MSTTSALPICIYFMILKVALLRSTGIGVYSWIFVITKLGVSKNTRHYIPSSPYFQTILKSVKGLWLMHLSHGHSLSFFMWWYVMTRGIRYFTLAHEIAHNLVQLHNSEHEFYFSAICEKYLVSLSKILNAWWLNSRSNW